MTEPDVTLTDYGLFILCTWMARKLWLQDNALMRHKVPWVIFFGSIAFASLIGGTVHGFYLDQDSLGHRILWPTTLLVTGVASASLWVIVGSLTTHSAHLNKWIWFSMASFIVYAIIVLFFLRQFSVAVIYYLPPIVTLLLIACTRYYRLQNSQHFLFLAGGVVVGIVAAFMQHVGVGIHPEYFNHNSTYHLVQALAFWMLYAGARRLLAHERRFT